METIEKKGSVEGRLFEKRRQLRERLSIMEEEIEEKRRTAGIMRKELADLNLGAKPPEKPIPSEEFFWFLEDSCVIMKKLLEDEVYLQSRYHTQITKTYYRIEKEVFERYIDSLSRLPQKDFIERCSKMNFIKTENGRNVFVSGKKRVYMVSRGIMDEMGKYSGFVVKEDIFAED